MAEPRTRFRGARTLAVVVVGTIAGACSSTGPKSLAPADGACIEVAGQPISTVVQQDGSSTAVIDVTSGDIRVGNFAIASAGLRTTTGAPIAKLYWIPTDVDIAKTAALTITIVDRDNPGKAESTKVFGGDGDWARIPNGQYFWPTDVVFPSAGSWRLLGSAPGLVGACFDIEIS